MAMCRACGDHPGDENRLKESLQKYFDIYYNLTSIRLTSDENPERQRICDDCHSKLLEYNRFRSTCLQVHYKLTEIKQEDGIDHSKPEIMEIMPLVGPLKVERLDYKEGDEPEVFEDGAADHDVDFVDENEEEEDDDDDKDKEFDHKLYKDLNSDTEDQTSDEDPKPEKKKKKRRKKGEGPKEQLLSCNQCERKFRTDQRLQGHLRTHLGLKPAVCNLCGKEFHKFYNLKLHMTRKHSDAKCEFLCDFPECGLSYSTKQGLTNHRRRHDPNFIQPIQKRVVCDQCGKTFSTAGALKKHSYIHSGDMPFQCQTCNKKLPTAHKLKEHTMRHEGIRNHVCPLCGLKKTTRHELTVHMNYHTREKQFTCHVCAQVFSNIGNMSRHIKIVHCGIKSYNCTYCDRSFGKAETLKHHVMTHTGEKPHECGICGKRFIQSVALQTHMRTHRKHLPPEQQQERQSSSSGAPYQHPNLGQQRSSVLMQAAAAAAAAAVTMMPLGQSQTEQLQQDQQQQQQSPDVSPLGDYVNHSV
ncbi:zinc finger protein 845-like [Armigeres subalbatus]|uniref:zinc finger protein 845-like n=1 Tax=Armigeres subalbatus TaxID=124917 RepID=UPI002ED377F4